MDGNDWSWRDGGDRGELGADTTPNPIGETPIEGGPPRRSTLDRFNAELAVLDRPLEDDVEYYDDPPPSPTWRRVSATLGAFVLLGAAAAFIVTRWSTPAVANEAESPRPATAAPAPATSAALPTPAPAPVAEEADDTPADDAPGLAPPAEPSDTAARGDWTTLQPAGARHKHGRAAQGSHHHHHHRAGR